ncbi:WD-40 repeat-containing protein [Reticulomyxa filosa]|uniref:WD-40 repeat-containing protein n=1 Tax=Reticulomyxa filosa TaxID=46433 RepID=X6LAE8_RETFI|nr:WD-40 repeat-containing protein [Reticulomyxa filosa]|eukprot:ETN98503.1 WD-40 repeat-containing protein [Reticulomyxa filosa]
MLVNNKQIQSFNGHSYAVYCVKFSQYHYHNNRQNVIFSSSFDNTIRFWDFKHNQQFVKYGSNELVNTILSGSVDKSIRLWDIRSRKQIQIFNGHTNQVWFVEYTSFVIKNGSGNSNVICSGSLDNTIQFWDIRSNKNELYVIKGNDKEDNGILCLKLLSLKKKEKNIGNTKDIAYDLNLCYGSRNRPIRIWG